MLIVLKEHALFNASNMDIFKNKTILITGGTGYFGQAFSKLMLQEHKPKELIIYSRDEIKQALMKQHFLNYGSIRFIAGDICNLVCLSNAFKGVDYVVHAAVFKPDGAIEYNPYKVVGTNVIGAMNVIEAALKRKVKKVIALSTNKIHEPINLYGATKICSDRLFIDANAYFSKKWPKLSVIRYGNIFKNKHSIITLFGKMKNESVSLSNNSNATVRLWITLDEAVRFAIRCFECMHGGEIFFPE